MGLSTLDWIILVSTLAFIVLYGTFKNRTSSSTESFIKGNKDEGWWTVCLSVMATQASAITFMSTPGQAFHDGMGFVQFYFGLPLAMIIICVTFIPMYHRLNVLSAYEYLEHRFDVKTRILTAILFLIQRGLAAGITIYAPSIILSTIMGWDLKMLNIIIGLLVILYTVSGGSKAVSVTQKQQMFVMIGGLFVVFFFTLSLLPENTGFTEIMNIAGKTGKLNILDFSINPESRYTVWSGLTGGLFLALSYFGTDQSQVQRYIAAKSVRESQLGLIWNGLLKIPMQFFILLCGVMVFVFFQFNRAPLFFNSSLLEKAKHTEYAADLKQYESAYEFIHQERQALLTDPVIVNSTDLLHDLNERENKLRAEVKATISKAVPNSETNDKDYVFIHFVLKYLPNGLVGILLAIIFCAAMSSSSSEISSLGSTSAIDLYKRKIRPDQTDGHYIKATKWLTFLWGLIAIGFACYGTLFENLIQLVNIVGSIFYGVILGIFLTGFYLKFIGANAIFYSAIVMEAIVIYVFKNFEIGYLWLNAVGCLGVIVIASVYTMSARLVGSRG